MKLTITKITRTQKISKSNKNYVSIGLQTKEYPNQWINGFGNKSNEYWKEGDVIAVKLIEDEWNGKKQLKFEQINEHEEVMDMLNKIYNTVKGNNSDNLF